MTTQIKIERSLGFTLVELIMVMLVIGIIAGSFAIFIPGPLKGYTDAKRRAQLTDDADTAIRRIAREVRSALPNSVRYSADMTGIEFIPTIDGARYRSQEDDGNEPPTGDPLDFSIADTSFDYFGGNIAGETGDFVVVFNTGQSGANAYDGDNRAKLTANISGNRVSFASFHFPFTSPGKRFHIVSASCPVTIGCTNIGLSGGNGTGSVQIYREYNKNFANPSAAPSSGNMLAEYVSGCEFHYEPGVTASNGLITLLLTLTRDDETVTLHHQIHVDNAP